MLSRMHVLSRKKLGRLTLASAIPTPRGLRHLVLTPAAMLLGTCVYGQTIYNLPPGTYASPVVQPLPTTPAAETIRTVPGQLRNPAAIASFLVKLPFATGAVPPLSIVQIGDSHTAGDMLTNGWRVRWQAEYGAGGRGAQAVGRPYPGYLSWGVTARQSPDWIPNSIFGRQRTEGGALLGLSGFTQTAQHAGASLSLSADSVAYQFDHFSLCGLTGPDKGVVHVAMSGTERDWSFAAATPGATCFDLTTPLPVPSVSITTVDDRPVSLTSWESQHQAGGLTLSNLGVVGSRLIHFTRNDDKVLGVELRHTHPDLVVIAFGTNEGFDPGLKLDEAETTMREQIARIRRLLGRNVPILLLGPPDAASSRSDVALPGLSQTVACGNGWSVPGNLARIRAMQIRLAQEMNLAFWDWQGAMGGSCTTMNWVAQGLQRGDHVHFTADGGKKLGEALAADLDRARLDLTK